MKKYQVAVEVKKTEYWIIEAESPEEAEENYYEGTPDADCYDEDLTVVSVKEVS